MGRIVFPAQKETQTGKKTLGFHSSTAPSDVNEKSVKGGGWGRRKGLGEDLQGFIISLFPGFDSFALAVAYHSHLPQHAGNILTAWEWPYGEALYLPALQPLIKDV